MSLISKPDVLIVGAGMAGLSAAVTLQKAGLEVLVIEGSQEVGGRVKTTRRDGYILDHGFQVFNPAYPNAKEILDYSKLNLRKFSPGVKITSSTRDFFLGNPLLDPTFTYSILKSPEKILDLAKFGAYCAGLLKNPEPNIFDTDARTALKAAKLSDDFIENTLKPFLSGVFLEADLKTSRRFLDFVLKYFITGNPSVPATGMAAIANQLASQIPRESLILGNWVHEINGMSLRTDAGIYSANHIVIATDQDTTAAWVGTQSRGWQAVTTWYHSTDIAREHLAGGKPLLHVDSDKRGPILNSIPISHAAASYAPPGRHLISTSTLGTDTSTSREYEVRSQLAHLYGVDTTNFELVDVFSIQKALPKSQVPFIKLREIEVRPNVFVAGDTFTTPSINGAIESGQNAAKAIISKIGQEKRGR